MSLKQTLKKCIRALLRRQTNTSITLQKLHQIAYKDNLYGGGGRDALIQHTCDICTKFAFSIIYNKKVFVAYFYLFVSETLYAKR
ncbi:hypothetical protein [Helicobacter equorum]|uniref:hypothetical protein n=1 Tax=Helicobacter equorum TaxID=361872 RepID=UPI000CF0663D|nr:hypothetical protein [Helicobacter equorum]